MSWIYLGSSSNAPARPPTPPPPTMFSPSPLRAPGICGKKDEEEEEEESWPFVRGREAAAPGRRRRRRRRRKGRGAEKGRLLLLLLLLAPPPVLLCESALFSLSLSHVFAAATNSPSLTSFSCAFYRLPPPPTILAHAFLSRKRNGRFVTCKKERK